MALDARGGAATYTAGRRMAPLRIWGMGIGSDDVTGDGYPEVYLTSQGANKLQTLADGPAKPAYRDIALERGVEATRPVTAATRLALDRVASGIRGRQQRRPRSTCSSRRATSSAQAGLRR